MERWNAKSPAPVSPKRQNRGIFVPTTPAQQAPELMPTRSFKRSPGRCRTTKLEVMSCSRWIDMSAISPACRSAEKEACARHGRAPTHDMQ